MRIDKYLCDCLIGTRSEVKNYIKKGLCTVNNSVIKDAGQQIDPLTDEIVFEGKPVIYNKYRYYILNKPGGYITATTDTSDKTVLDLLPNEIKKNLFPVGRLDKDTEGLLILTNDGELSHKLLSPKYHVDKCYYCELAKEIDESSLKPLNTGIDIGDDKPTKPATYSIISPTSVLLTIYEGRYHQVKRMFIALDNKITYLKRISFGPLKLDDYDLKPGEFKQLNNKDIALLKDYKYVKD